MTAERRFTADLAGINAEVIRPIGLGLGGVGIACFSAQDEGSGELLFGLAIRHPDGETLSALLDEDRIHRLAAMMADYVEALPAIRSKARH